MLSPKLRRRLLPSRHQVGADALPPEFSCSHRKQPVRFALLLASLVGIGVFTLCGRVATAKSKPVPWKTIDDAILRVNDEAVKDWSVYQTGKKRDPLLLQIGNRFLLIDVHGKQLFEVDSTKVERKSDAEVDWDPADRPSQPLASSDWTAGDVGAAMQIKLTISGENRILNLELPHPLDVGDLPNRPTSPQRHR